MSANIQGVCQDMLTELSFTKKTLRPGFICRKVSVFFFIFAWPVVIDLSLKLDTSADAQIPHTYMLFTK